MGTAIADFWKHGVAGRLRVFSPDFDEDEIPVDTLFREIQDMPAIEQTALRMARGKILDVGAGAGCHAIALQEMDKTVTAIDISQLSVDTMLERGIDDVRLQDFFTMTAQDSSEKYDTILMLMNGIGIAGTIERLPDLFDQCKALLSDGGMVLLDSSDIRYVFEEDDGSFSIDLNDNYYGELTYQMQYKRIKGEPFQWLYIDFATLQAYAEEHGLCATLIEEGEHYDYLAKIERM